MASLKKNILVIYGPTASGKTSFSYEIIKFLNINKNISIDQIKKIIQLIYSQNNINFTNNAFIFNLNLNNPNICIINMDSKQIYSHLSSLTASPTYQEKSQNFHYLFNYYSPDDFISVNQWLSNVNEFIDNSHYDLYLMVGGSNFYLKYLLTHEIIIDNKLDCYDDLINIFLNNFSWHNIVKIFSPYIHRFIPNINDNFRKFNFIKSYFLQYHGGCYLDFKHNVNHINLINIQDYVIEKNYYIIVINPSMKILNNNIIQRFNTMNIIDLQWEYNLLKKIYTFHKNFFSIIGINYLINRNYQQFIIENLRYIKHQKKWINYFLKHEFFNYSYIAIWID